MEKQTSTQRFINVAVAFWKASGELAEVGSKFSNDHGRRTAHAEMDRLDEKLKGLIEDWNSELFHGEQAIIECSSSNATGNHGCEIFTAQPDSDGRCKPCRDREAERVWEDRRERLMEDGGVDDSAYRLAMKDAGRSHLLA
jgi:hypothetical protein